MTEATEMRHWQFRIDHNGGRGGTIKYTLVNCYSFISHYILKQNNL